MRLRMNSSDRSKKIPLDPPFSKGEGLGGFPSIKGNALSTLLWKRRVGEDFISLFLPSITPFPRRDSWLARNRTHGRAAESARGFTLLELLISIALVLSVVLIASGAMRLGQRAVVSGDRKVERLERLRTAVSVLDAQIQSSVPLTYEENGVRQYHFRGDGAALRLTTNHSLWDAEKGYVVASWRVERNEAGTVSLFLKEQLVGTERTREAKILEGLDEMSFAFLQSGPVGGKDRWVEDWHDATELPREVRIRMASGSWHMALVIPLRATGTLAPASWAETEGKL